MTDLQTHTTPEMAKCACGHEVVVHQLIVNSKGTRRGPCTRMGPEGRCECRSPR